MNHRIRIAHTPLGGLCGVSGILLASVILGACSSKSSKGDDPEEEKIARMECVEIMYDAGPEDSLEFIVLRNSGEAPLDLATARIQEAVDYVFPAGAGELTPGQQVVIANYPDLFMARYPGVVAFGPFIGRLANDGEVIEVRIPGPGDVDCAFSSEAPWPSMAAGGGHSLVYIGGDAEQPLSWRASLQAGGNPGGEAAVAAEMMVRVNEVMPFRGEDGGWVELFNTGAEAVNVSGWHMATNVKSLTPMVLPEGSLVPAGGFLLLPQLNSEGGLLWSVDFVPTPRGNTVHLIQTQAGVRLGSASSLTYPALAEGFTAGVLPVSAGSLSMVPLATPSPGAANSPPLIGPVVISEIHYNPPEGQAEFLELLNNTAEAIELGPIGMPEKAWKMGGIGFTFPEGASIPANGRLVLVNSADASPELFRSTAAIAPTVPVYGYEGKLSNSGERLTVRMPLVPHPLPTGVTEWYMGWSDVVEYHDAEPWAADADGLGKSLHRVLPAALGDEAASWVAGDPSPGL